MDDQDTYFLNFFHRVVEDDLERDSRSDHKDILRRVQADRWGSERLCHASPAMRCALVSYYAPCLASTLYSHFAQLVERNSFLLRRTILRQSLTVCCFSNGLSVDFLALATLLERTLRDCCPGANVGAGRTYVEFVVVSTDPVGWTGMQEKMAEELSRDLRGKSAVSVNLRVLVSGAGMPLTDEIKEALNQSDIVTVIHCVNSARESERTARLELIKAIVRFIPGGGVIFFLDTPSGGICEILEENLESCDESLVGIYGPLKYNVHRMRLLCRKECIRLYSKKYGWRCCALEGVSYVHAWYKRTSHCM